ncbi:MAG: sulfur carrier protein ThiS [Candidatus Kapabacteria bacterium]|nr:sulfur carrier protein ThiS [Candidatus Kapabacteria bacterium]
MDLTVNGEPATLVEAGTIAELLQQQGIEPTQQGIAVAVNDTVIPRRSWPTHKLQEGDRVEVITAMQGG